MAPPLAGFRVLDLSGCLPGCMARCSLTRITVNLKSADGPEIIQRLACVSDVLVENFKVGELAQLGLGYERLRELNPELVYCSITRYGQTGPDKDLPGYDFIIQGRGGVMSITGVPDGEPMNVGVAIVDITAGLCAASAIQAALD